MNVSCQAAHVRYEPKCLVRKQQTPRAVKDREAYFHKTINVQFLRKIFQGMKIHLPYAIFNSSKMVFNSTPF